MQAGDRFYISGNGDGKTTIHHGFKVNTPVIVESVNNNEIRVKAIAVNDRWALRQIVEKQFLKQ